MTTLVGSRPPKCARARSDVRAARSRPARSVPGGDAKLVALLAVHPDDDGDLVLGAERLVVLRPRRLGDEAVLAQPVPELLGDVRC